MAKDNYSDLTEQAFDPANEISGKRGGYQDKDDQSLLEMDKSEAAKCMMRDWDSSWKDIKNVSEQWRVNKARNEGYTGVSILKKQDRAEAHIPMGAKKGIQGLNKAARLCRGIGSALFTDPPKPEATPAGDDDEDRDAAETSTRVLVDLCSEGNLDYALASRDAFDRGAVYGSGFIRFWVDETGGGWTPKEIEASPHAVDPNDPFPGGDKSEAILRYVTEDGQFTDQKMEAKRVWQPKVKRELLTGKHVRFLPYNGTRDIWDADGVQIGCARSLGEIKRMFPEIKKWDSERIGKLVSTRPQHFDELLPAGRKDPGADPTKDESMCFVLTRFHVQSPQYPEGCYIVAAGTDEILYRGEWFDAMHGEPLDIPITQFKHLSEEGNPYGSGMMEHLGPGNEIRSQMVASWLEHLDRFNNRRLFVPLTSTLQAHQLQSPTGTPIPILPGGEPKYEEIPDFPVITEKMLSFISAEMDDESKLQQVGQGLNPSGVKSGLHANAIREQVQVGLSDLRENTERGLVRGWRIVLQLGRAHYNQPQQIRWVGPDGSYKVDRWSHADLGGTKDVRVQRGSFTGLTPTGKANVAVEYAQLGILPPAELTHIMEGQVGGALGLQENAHRLRVKRQIALWEEGPPEGWAPQPPQMDPATGQPVPTPDPLLSQIWDVRPSDALPHAAAIRLDEIGRAMAGTTFARWPQEWQAGMVQAINVAKQYAQVMDAESTMKLQQELAQTKEKLLKAESVPKTSVAVQMADLDPIQTQQVMQHVGLPVPPSTMPVLDPVTEFAAKTEQDMEKHKISTAADIEKHKMTVSAQPKVASGAQRDPEGRSPKKPKGADNERLGNALKVMTGGKK